MKAVLSRAVRPSITKHALERAQDRLGIERWRDARDFIYGIVEFGEISPQANGAIWFVREDMPGVRHIAVVQRTAVVTVFKKYSRAVRNELRRQKKQEARQPPTVALTASDNPAYSEGP